MRGLFDVVEDEEEVERAAARRDPELTLGAGTLLGIFFVLAVICGLCFGLGYAMGRRSLQETPIAQAAPGSAAVEGAKGDGSKGKPAAGPQSAAVAEPSAVPSAGVDQAAVSGLDRKADGSEQQTAAAVEPAMRSAAPVATAPAGKVKPALPSASPAELMVQIAAVSHPEDADVLMGALRKRGYAVGSRREPADGLIHVRIGPFRDRSEAELWRQKLLNDGYNAIVQP
jgi:cell division septation protein DedD